MIFALRLKELREQAGLTQAQLANAMGVGVSTVGMWESTQRTPSSKTLKKLIEYFNVSLPYLLGDTDINDTEKFFIEKNTPQLTAEEWQFIEDFRALGIPGKQLIKTTMKTLLQTSEAVKNNKKDIS